MNRANQFGMTVREEIANSAMSALLSNHIFMEGLSDSIAFLGGLEIGSVEHAKACRRAVATAAQKHADELLDHLSKPQSEIAKLLAEDHHL